MTSFINIKCGDVAVEVIPQWTACIRHAEACWQTGQMFEWTWTICWEM